MRKYRLTYKTSKSKNALKVTETIVSEDIISAVELAKNLHKQWLLQRVDEA